MLDALKNWWTHAGVQKDDALVKDVLIKSVIIILSCQIPLSIGMWVIGESALRIFSVLGSWLAISAVVLMGVKRNNVDTALNALVVLGSALALLVFASSSGGISSPGMFFQFFLVTLGAAAGSQRAIVLSLVSCLACDIYLVGMKQSWIDVGAPSQSQWRGFLVAISYFVMTSAMAWLSVASMSKWRRESQDKTHDFTELFERSPVGKIAFDVQNDDFKVLAVNHAAMTLLGKMRDQMVGQPMSSWLIGVDSGELASFKEAIKNPAGVDGHFLKFKTLTGEEKLIELNSMLGRVGGRMAILVTLMDRTEQELARQVLLRGRDELERRVEERTAQLVSAQREIERQERMASIGAMVAGLAHEMNTPIGNALLTASTIREKASAFVSGVKSQTIKRGEIERFGEQAGQGAKMIESSMERARDLIHRCRLMASERATFRIRDFDLRECVEHTLDMAQPSIRKCPAKVIVTVKGLKKLPVRSYAGEVGHIVASLLANALEHGFHERTSGSIVIEVLEAAPGVAAVRVSDDGAGMSAESKAKAFEAFYTTARERGSVGLGLTICSELARGVLGGRVDLAVGETGVSATLYLPKSAPESLSPP